MECFTAICSQFNAYQPITIKTMESNASIQFLLSSVEHLSYEASHALRFRLQRNLLPALTEEGNITPGLVCSAHPVSDPDVRFILSVNKNSVSTPQSVRSSDIGSVEPPIAPAKIPANNSKLLQMAMPFATKKTNTNDEVRPAEMASRPSDNSRLTFCLTFDKNSCRKRDSNFLFFSAHTTCIAFIHW